MFDTNSTKELIRALKVQYNSNDVVAADSAHDGETNFAINGDFVVSVFSSIEAAKRFYVRTYQNYIQQNSSMVIGFFDEHLGKNRWMDYVSRQRLIKILIKTIKKIQNGELEEETETRIKNKPMEVLKSLFNLNKQQDKNDFYAVILETCDQELFEDAVDAMLGGSMVNVINKMYVPRLDKHYTLIEFKTKT